MTSAGSAALKPLNIALLCGGTSAERDISLQSGEAVHDALEARGHRVSVIDPQETDVRRIRWHEFELAFIALHGTFGEDGEVQRILEAAGVPFTGSGSGPSRLAFSKSAAKQRFIQFDVPAPYGVLVHETDTAARIEQRVRTVGYPLVVKPDAQGSSLGVSIVREPAELPEALSRCFHFHPFGLLERYIAGTEWTVAAIDDDMLSPLQIEPASQFFDYRSKYESDETRYRFASVSSSAVQDRLRETARRTCAALGTRGAVRVDMMLDRCENPWVLEVNTVPGMTAHSLLPKAAAYAGLTFEDLCDLLVQRARACVTRRAA